VKLSLFIATSLCAGLAGMLEMSNFGSVDPLAGNNYELTVIAAVVIGGTSLRGGTGSVVGAAFGVITFGIIQVGLQLASVPVYYFQALVGLVLLAAMILQLYTSRVAVALRSREIAEYETRAAPGEASA
jgi:ribose/xylose/arabinose/galactoside ABC-type transport system permease subunit